MGLKSEVNKGSKFTFYLKSFPEKIPKSVEVRSCSPMRVQGTCSCIDILVVDDDEIVRFSLEQILTKMDKYTIDQAKNGNKAIQKVQQRMQSDCCRSFIAIFMDVNMPECDGHSATRTIRSLGYKKPIIGYTAYSHSRDVEACKEAGMDEVLNKPSNPDKILKLIKDFVNQYS